VAVYLDDSRNRFGRMIMCHMVADTLEELHEMADRIGMRREWFQPRSSPHYDVCLTLSKRALAIRFGALEVDKAGLVEVVRRKRKGGAA